MCGRTYVIYTLTLKYFCVSSVVDPIPKFTEQKPLDYRSLPISSPNGIELFTTLNSFILVELKLREKLTGVHFYLMCGGSKLMCYLSHL